MPSGQRNGGHRIALRWTSRTKAPKRTLLYLEGIKKYLRCHGLRCGCHLIVVTQISETMAPRWTLQYLEGPEEEEAAELRARNAQPGYPAGSSANACIHAWPCQSTFIWWSLLTNSVTNAQRRFILFYLLICLFIIFCLLI